MYYMYYMYIRIRFIYREEQETQFISMVSPGPGVPIRKRRVIKESENLNYNY